PFADFLPKGTFAKNAEPVSTKKMLESKGVRRAKISSRLPSRHSHSLTGKENARIRFYQAEFPSRYNSRPSVSAAALSRNSIFLAADPVCRAATLSNFNFPTLSIADARALKAYAMSAPDRLMRYRLRPFRKREARKERRVWPGRWLGRSY